MRATTQNPSKKPANTGKKSLRIDPANVQTLAVGEVRGGMDFGGEEFPPIGHAFSAGGREEFPPIGHAFSAGGREEVPPHGHAFSAGGREEVPPRGEIFGARAKR